MNQRIHNFENVWGLRLQPPPRLVRCPMDLDELPPIPPPPRLVRCPMMDLDELPPIPPPPRLVRCPMMDLDELPDIWCVRDVVNYDTIAPLFREA